MNIKKVMTIDELKFVVMLCDHTLATNTALTSKDIKDLKKNRDIIQETIEKMERLGHNMLNTKGGISFKD